MTQAHLCHPRVAGARRVLVFLARPGTGFGTAACGRPEPFGFAQGKLREGSWRGRSSFAALRTARAASRNCLGLHTASLLRCALLMRERERQIQATVMDTGQNDPLSIFLLDSGLQSDAINVETFIVELKATGATSGRETPRAGRGTLARCWLLR